MGKPEPAPEKTDDFAKKIKRTQAQIVKLLKSQGKYTEELAFQIEVTATLKVKYEKLYVELLSETADRSELSREGHLRNIANPKEKLLLDYANQLQKSLRSLGMNTDAKERKSDNDTFGAFIKDFGDD